MASLTCPKCQKPLKYAPSRPTFQHPNDLAELVTGKIDLVCSDSQCKGRGTTDVDDMRRKADEAEKAGNTAAGTAIRDELKRLGR